MVSGLHLDTKTPVQTRFQPSPATSHHNVTRRIHSRWARTCWRHQVLFLRVLFTFSSVLVHYRSLGSYLGLKVVLPDSTGCPLVLGRYRFCPNTRLFICLTFPCHSSIKSESTLQSWRRVNNFGLPCLAFTKAIALLSLHCSYLDVSVRLLLMP